jgi:hypothetical protein
VGKVNSQKVIYEGEKGVAEFCGIITFLSRKAKDKNHPNKNQGP